VQLRKILELFAFASLCANRQIYEAAHADFARHWRAKALLESLGVLHPDYYPVPVRLSTPNPDGTKHFARVEDGFLTPDEFIILYDKCSQVLHTRNPFAAGHHRIDFTRSVEEWLNRIKTLLLVHVIRLAGSPEIWLVVMSSPPDGRVHAYQASPTSEPALDSATVSGDADGKDF
jgi:hypothetical protein